MYWPLQVDPISTHEINLCSFAQFEHDGKNITTLCGDNGRIDDFFDKFELFPSVPNPAFNDTVGVPTEFGMTGAACASPIVQDDIESNQSGEPEELDKLEASDEPEESDEPACFPASATVITRDNRLVRMDRLEVGEEIAVGRGKFSTMFMWSHADRRARHEFVRIRTEANNTLVLSSGHFVPVRSTLKRAKDVHVGDVLETGWGSVTPVVAIDKVWDIGLFNPHTMHGDIVVEGVVTSTFT